MSYETDATSNCVPWYLLLYILYLYVYLARMYSQLDSKEQKFNDSSIQVDNFRHSSFEKLEVKHICSDDTCGACKPPEIKLRLTLRSFAIIYVSIFCNM